MNVGKLTSLVRKINKYFHCGSVILKKKKTRFQLTNVRYTYYVFFKKTRIDHDKHKKGIYFRNKQLIIIKLTNQCESPWGDSKTREPRGPPWGRGAASERAGSAQVAARIDRPGCALQCRRDQPTHLLAELHGRARIEYYVVRRTPLAPSVLARQAR